MIRIAIVADDSVPPSVRFYRTYGPFFLLEKPPYYFRVDRVPIKAFLSHESNGFAYDVALIEKPITAQAYSAIRLCKDQRIMVWLDYDDNLFSIPAGNSTQDYYDNARTQDIIKQCLSSADIVTCATDYLASLCQGFNKNTVTVPNAWNDYKFQMSPITDVDNPIKMVWRGSATHQEDLRTVSSPMARCAADPAFQWSTYGYWPHFVNIKRSNYDPWTGLFMYFNQFFGVGGDYLFVPLNVNNFNRAKSNISWQEATISGMVTIAPIGLPEFDKPGVIRYKDNAHLDKIFTGIKKGNYDKAERVEASREHLKENFRLSEVNKLRGSIISSAFGLAQVQEEVIE